MVAETVRARPVRSVWSKVILWVVVGVLILLLVAFFGIGAYAASVFTLPARHFNPDLNPGMHNLQYEEFTFPAREDGLSIAAWYIPSDLNQKVIILVHGRDNSRTNGFLDLFVPFANELHKAGFSVMMIDLRGHGESADSRYHFGVTEQRDVLGAVDWLKSRGYQPGQIGVLAYSLGAGSAIGAAAQERDIAALWLDSAYADIKPVVQNAFTKVSGMPTIFFYSTVLMNRLLYGYDINDSKPINDIEKINPRPIFLAHCKEDGMIPISNMEQIHAVAENSQTWIIPNCNVHDMSDPPADFDDLNNHHALGYPLNPEEYTQKVVKFFDENLH